MTRIELVDAVMENCEAKTTKKEASDLIDTFLQVVVEVVKQEGECRLANFGTFKLKERKARTGRNPKTGEAVKIKASKSMSFKVSKQVKVALK